jgi:DNA-binding transcriptional MerR regulator/methylmalonyl-CoA mutase cobalamin-binding subunit
MTNVKSRRRAAPAAAIALVERETGLAKETLRVWERRYGFPRPRRDARGGRVYPPEQIDKLRIIRRLMDRGLRPGKLVNASLAELAAQSGEPRRSEGRSAPAPGLARYLALIKSQQSGELQQQLAQDLLRLGLLRFVVEVVAPLNVLIGQAWTAGEIEIFEEHLYSEQVQHLLRQASGTASHPARTPRVLLTTLPGEQHQLGLLMAQSVLTGEGAECISLGRETPPGDIVLAVRAHRVDIVGLSFSQAMRLRSARDALADLRLRLDHRVALWAGGGLWQRLKQPPAGVTLLPDLGGIAPALAQWRAGRAAAAA